MSDITGTTLEIRHLRVSYGRVPVLRDVTISVPAGSVVGLIGRNGAGKTSTLRAVSGVIRRGGGQILLHGAPLPASPHKVASLGVIHVPEGRGLIPGLSVYDNLRVGCAAVGKPLGADQLDFVATHFPKVPPLFDRKASLLSGGEQQMVALARGLVTEPTVLMVDELSLGLAPKAVAEVLTALLDATRSNATSLLIVDQNVRALSKICDRLHYLHDGVSSEVGSDVTDETALRSIYFS